MSKEAVIEFELSEVIYSMKLALITELIDLEMFGYYQIEI